MDTQKSFTAYRLAQATSGCATGVLKALIGFCVLTLQWKYRASPNFAKQMRRDPQRFPSVHRNGRFVLGAFAAATTLPQLIPFQCHERLGI